MAVVLGTNGGFVTAAPVDDPADSNLTFDSRSIAHRDSSAATASRVTEMGWYCDNATEAADFDMGIYDDSSDEPNNRVHVDAGNAKGVGAGWKTVVGLNWSISPSTAYWLAVQLDNTATATNTNMTSSGADKYVADFSETSLVDPWGAVDATYARVLAVYAVWEAASAAAGQVIRIIMTKATKRLIDDSIRIYLAGLAMRGVYTRRELGKRLLVAGTLLAERWMV